MKTTTCVLLLAAAAWGQQVAVPQGGSLGPSSKLSDAATLSADKVDGSHSSSTPGANAVPVAEGNGKLAPGWIPLPTSSSIGGIFMDADCLTGNHVSGIDAASGRLECSVDAADWSTIANKPAAFPPDTSSQAWQDLLTGMDTKLATSALDSTLIVSKFNGGACSGYLKSNGGCDTPSGTEGTPSLDETTVTGSVYSSKPFKVAGTQTDIEVVEGAAVEVAGENHWSVDSATHRPAYSYNGATSKKVAWVDDPISAEDVSGLGNAATKNVGTDSGTVAAGDDSRITGAVQSSALDSTLIVGKFGGGGCSGYLKSDGTCDTGTGSEATPALDETTTPGSVHSSKPIEIAGSLTDYKITEGAPTLPAGENHFFFDPSTHRPAYSYNGGAASKVAFVGDMVTAAQLPAPTETTLGGVKSKVCDNTDKISAIGTDGTPVCSSDQAGSGGASDWFAAPATTHDPDTEGFSGSVDVTIGGCSGGTAYYTTDGGSTISTYSSPLHLTGTTTLVSRCEKDHYEPSAAKTSTYTINAASGNVGVLMFPTTSTNGAPRYFSVGGQNQGTEANAQVGSPIGGNITAVYCNAAVAPSGGTDVVKLRINGADAATCTIADGAHAASVDLSGSPVTLAKGDLINGAVTTLKTTSVFSLWVRVESVTSGVVAMPMFTLAGYGTGSTNYFSLGAKTTGATGLAIGAPLTGTLAEMYVGSSASTSTSEDFTFKDVTGSTTLATCALASGTHAACTGLTGSLTKAHLINAGAVNNSGSTATFGLYGRMEGVSAGVVALSFFNYAPIAASSTGYFSAGSESATETDVAIGSPVGGSIKEMYAVSDFGPAAGTPDVITLNINGVPQDGQSGHGTMQCTMTNPAVTCSYTGSVSINKGDLLSFTANNSQASNGAKFGVYLRVEGAN